MTSALVRNQPRSRANPAAVTVRYTYRVSWSVEDQEFVAICAEFPSLSHFAGSQAEALEGIGSLIGDVVAGVRGAGEDIPEQLTERRERGRVSAGRLLRSRYARST